MLYMEIMTVCSEIHTKHTHKLQLHHVHTLTHPTPTQTLHLFPLLSPPHHFPITIVFTEGRAGSAREPADQ